MRSLAGLLADGVLADTILILPRPPKLTTNTRRVRGPQKSTETSNTKTIKKGDVGISKQDELSTTLYLQSK